MEDVLDVYQRPYDPAHPVVCLDEARRQLTSETRTGFIDEQGVEHYDYDRDGGPLQKGRGGQSVYGRRAVRWSSRNSGHGEPQ